MSLIDVNSNECFPTACNANESKTESVSFVSLKCEVINREENFISPLK